MNFKEQLKADINGFLNTEEFGEKMLVNGKQMSVIFDTDTTSGSGTNETPGVYSAHKMRYTVVGEVKSEDGLYTIPIERRRVQ